MINININDLEVTYPIFDADDLSMRKNIISSLQNKKLSKFKFIKALNNINLHFEKGDRVGLIGNNGAGKTTLLKTIGGIIEPTNGNIEIKGNVLPLLDLNLGLQPDVSGFENIFIICHLFGIEKKEILKKIDNIIVFSELEENIYRAVRTYSSGMLVRLTSSIILSFESEILLIDEFVGAGDSNFLNKLRKKIQDKIENSGIFILSTHNEVLIKKYCNKIIELENGEIKEIIKL